MSSKKVLIFGGSGFLGSHLQKYFHSQDVLAPSRDELDLFDTPKVLRYIAKHKPAIIIYVAGITKINFAEKNKALTNKLNHLIPKTISRFAAKNQIHFIYISTDAVFDGYKTKFIFSESDKPQAKSSYGLSKLHGEFAVMSNNPNNTIIRLITLFGIDKTHQNFMTKVYDDLKNNKHVFGISDQLQNPLYVEIAAEAISYISNRKLTGIYHLGATDYVTNYDLLIKFANKFNMDHSLIKEISFIEFFGNNFKYRKRQSILLCKKFVEISDKKFLRTMDSSLDFLYAKTVK